MKNRILISLIFFILGYFLLFTILYLTKINYYYLWSLIGGFSLLIITIPITLKIKINDINYDNSEVFKTCFHKIYWLKSFNELKKIKNLVMISALIALMLLSKLITLPSGFGLLGLSFSYIFLGLGALLYGPIAGLLMGFLSDNLEFVLFPTGFPYFIGYSISSMLAGFICGILFYKTKLSFFKVFISRFLINILINAILGTIWYGIVANYTNFNMYLDHFLIIALPKNLVYLIPQSILLFLIIKALSRVFVSINLMNLEIKENIKLF